MKASSELNQELKVARQQASDFAVAFDLMAKITYSGDEKEAIESILQLFTMLFSPEILHYVSLKNGEPDQVYCFSASRENETEIKSRTTTFKGKYKWLNSHKGFQVKITYQGTDFGILEVDNLKFPEHKEHYLNLTLSITNVCGLVIENARRHQEIKDAESKTRLEKIKLEQALAEIRKLSGLLPICSHCKKIRDDKGYWTEIESYINDHSEAEFSHSICRECADIHYPNMGLYDDSDS